MPGKRVVTVGIVQMICVDDRKLNFEKAEQLISECAKQGAKLVCLQELSYDLYFCQEEDYDKFNLAESMDGSIHDFSSEMARKYNLVLLAGIFERRAPGVFHNSFLIFENDGTRVGVYRKAHIPDDPSYYEKFFFTPGDDPFPVFETSAGRVGVCICWDQWYPEASRLTAMKGAEMIFYPTAIGWLAEDKTDFGTSQKSAWQTMMRSHSIANGIYVLAPNRCGTESKIEFWGSSFISDPYGNILQEANVESDEVIVQELDLSLIESARTHWPFFRDRRIDLYGDLTKRWREDIEQPSGSQNPIVPESTGFPRR